MLGMHGHAGLRPELSRSSQHEVADLPDMRRPCHCPLLFPDRAPRLAWVTGAGMRTSVAPWRAQRWLFHMCPNVRAAEEIGKVA